MTIKYKQNSCQEQQAGQEQDTEQVECPEAIPEANFKCGNNNSCCGGEVRDEIRKEKKTKNWHTAQSAQNVLRNVFKFNIKNIGAHKLGQT